ARRSPSTQWRSRPRGRRSRALRPFARVRREQRPAELLATEAPDELLPRRRHDEARERLAAGLIRDAPRDRPHGDHVVDVAQIDGVFDERHQLDRRPLREVRAVVAERVGRLLRRDVQRVAHPASRLHVPAAGRRDAGGLPQRELFDVGPRVVAARDERRAGPRDRRERGLRGRQPLDVRRIGRRPDDDERVVHDERAREATPLRHERVLGGRRVDEQHVGVAAHAHRERRAGAHGDGLHPIAGRLFECRDEHVEQAGVLRARRRGKDHGRRGDRGGGNDRKRRTQGDEGTAEHPRTVVGRPGAGLRAARAPNGVRARAFAPAPGRTKARRNAGSRSGTRTEPMELRIDADAVAGARRLAAAIVDPVEEFIARHSTVSVERAIARLCGVDGVDANGVPLPNRLIDALPRREGGIARALGAALAETGAAPSQIAERVAAGEPLPDPDRTPEVAARAALRPWVERGLARIDSARRERDALLARLPQDDPPLLYVIVASGNIYEDRTAAIAAAEAGAQIVAVIRSTAQSLLDYVPYGATTEGFGGTYATQENFRIMRAALDEVSE